MLKYSDAKEEYEKFIKESKGFLGIGYRGGRLKSFLEIQKEYSAYQGSDLGLRTVDISEIKGSVQKYKDFNKNFVPRNRVIESRWCGIYLAYMNDDPIPPVELYKIKDDYFVYDGNHRVSVAKYLNFASIEAEVKEFLPSEDSKENVIYREKFNFEKQTNLYGIKFTETDQYKRLLKEIEDFKQYLSEKENINISLQEAAEMWNENIFTPSIVILSENNLLKNCEDRTYADLFVNYLDHKYFESVDRSKDVGFEFAIVNYINLVKTNQNSEETMLVSDSVKENLEKLRNIDERKKRDLEINRKSDILKEITGFELEHQLLLIYEVEDYMSENDISDFETAVKEWNENKVEESKNYFKTLIQNLPPKYKKFGELLLRKGKKLFISLFSYEKYRKKSDGLESAIAHYILEVFIPLSNKILKRDIDEKELKSLYFEIQNRFFYYKDYEADITIEKVCEIYFASEIKKNYTIGDILLMRFNNSKENRDLLVKYIFDQYRDKIKNYNLFKKVFEKYGFPVNPGTFVELYSAYLAYMSNGEGNERDWIKEKLIFDLEKLNSSDQILAFYKTYLVFKDLNYGVKDNNLIDFYADILSFGEYLGRDIGYIDIIDLAVEYKNSLNI